MLFRDTEKVGCEFFVLLRSDDQFCPDLIWSGLVKIEQWGHRFEFWLLQLGSSGSLGIGGDCGLR